MPLLCALASLHDLFKKVEIVTQRRKSDKSDRKGLEAPSLRLCDPTEICMSVLFAQAIKPWAILTVSFVIF